MTESRFPETGRQRIVQAEVLGHSLETILSEASMPEHSLASGSAAALSVALAAALASSAARALPEGAETAGYVVQAENLKMRAAGLVDRNRDHYEIARKALEARKEDPGYRDHRIGEAMKDTLGTLGLVAGAAADTAELAANLAGIATDELKPDAVSAAALAEAGARVACILVEANLLSVGGGDLVEIARAELAAAETSSRQAIDMLA